MVTLERGIFVRDKLPTPETLRFMPVRTAVVGVGSISTPYVEYLHQNKKEISLVACSDTKLGYAQERAEALKIGRGRGLTNDELLSDPSIEMVVNLTPAPVHYNVTKAALEAGKHVFTEKPLAATFKEGKELVELAREKNLYLACAPDTFLGSHFQTARQLIEEGKIGEISYITGILKDEGPISHRNPMPFYMKGGGPVFDWGPYYLTHAVNLLGSIESVSAEGKINQEELIVQNPQSSIIRPQVPTNVKSTIKFHSGAVMDLELNWDTSVEKEQVNREIVIHGTDGTIRMVSPNQYDGSLLLSKKGSEYFEEVELLFDEVGKGVRGYGVTEFARAIRTGQPTQLDAARGLYVLEVMEAIETSCNTRGEEQYLTTTADRSVPLLPREVYSVFAIQ